MHHILHRDVKIDKFEKINSFPSEVFLVKLALCQTLIDGAISS